MIKKIIIFAFCLAPIGAKADDCHLIDNVWHCNTNLTGPTMPLGSSYAISIEGGNGVVAGASGININNMYIGYTFATGNDPNGDLYVTEDASFPFTIVSNSADITIRGDLQIDTNRTLEFNTDTDSTGNRHNITINGNVSALGGLNIENVANFSANTITSNTNLNIVNADNITTGAINIEGGPVKLSATDTLTMLQFQIAGNGTSDLLANKININGDIQNNAGNMTVNAGGTINITGKLENKGASSMLITSGDAMTVGGVIINDLDGIMTINATGLTVNGGDVDTASIITKGELELNISGSTYLEYGYYLDNTMDIDNNFVLKTDSLQFGDNISDTMWLSMGTNDLNSYKINVTSGDLTLKQIINGRTNTNANMQLIANSVKLKSILNQGNQLKIESMAGDINVTDDIKTTLANSKTYLTSAQNITAGNIINLNGSAKFDANAITTTGISQTGGTVDMNTTTLNITGNIDATNLRVNAKDDSNWLNVTVDGSIYGGTAFIGLKNMHINGGYTFAPNSMINAVVLDSDTIATITQNSDGFLENISGATNNIISVDGSFVSTGDMFNPLTINDQSAPGSLLQTPQIGLVLNKVVDSGSAIWLLHADGGVYADGIFANMRNLDVRFCNADGTICYNYLDSFNAYNGTPDTELPAYLSVYDSDNDGIADDIYIVFDSRFGGPILVPSIKPIVIQGHGDLESADAFDNLIAARIRKTGFEESAPIEVLPLIFQGTNLSEMSQELYDRLNYYSINHDATGVAQLTHLFRPQELNQIIGNLLLSEHTNAHSFESRMIDEFIWNRNRNLKKAWLDIDNDLFIQNIDDNKHSKGYRFNIKGGFDWQNSKTLLLGLTGRISYTNSDYSKHLDLGYNPNNHYQTTGHIKTTLEDINIGLGAYLIKILSNQARLYGNLFVDYHKLDVTREQNFVSKIDGDGSAFSITTEWGFLHDLLNQYLVGNAYVRMGYNNGFSVTEKASGADYMKLKSDSYLVVTPGYSLTAQKRIYPSVWFQFRPYITGGIEYDILSTPDKAQYKFTMASKYSDYDIDMNKFWVNAGTGIEFLSVSGTQLGIGYKYQTNADIKSHNIKLSGSYRF